MRVSCARDREKTSTRRTRGAHDFFGKYQDEFCSARTRTDRTSIRTTGLCSRCKTVISITTVLSRVLEGVRD